MTASSRWEAAYFLGWGELRSAVSGTEVVESVGLELCNTSQPMLAATLALQPGLALRLAEPYRSLCVYLTIRFFNFTVLNYQYIVKTSQSTTRKILTNILGELLGSSDRLWSGTARA